jgi:hypothetical protein
MKREMVNRLLISFALFLTIWSSMINSINDQLTRVITVAGIAMFLYSFPVALYFIPHLQMLIPERYRVLTVLDPINYAETTVDALSDKLGVSLTRRQSTRGGLESSSSGVLSRASGPAVARNESSGSVAAAPSNVPYLVRHQRSLDQSMGRAQSTNLDSDEEVRGLRRVVAGFWNGWIFMVKIRKCMDPILAVSRTAVG